MPAKPTPTRDPVLVDARGMRCPWPALRAARALRGAMQVIVLADDPIAPGELAALAAQNGWAFSTRDHDLGPAFALDRKIL